MADKKARPNKKRGILWLVIVLAVIGICVSAYRLLSMGREQRAQEAAQQALRETVLATPAPLPVEAAATPEPLPGWQGWMAAYAKEPDRKVDFEALRQINENIYAWISVPGTSIDYPVVHASLGDERYLEHDIEGNASKHGAIFTDGYNSLGFSDPVTVVYGHNMKDGTMFAPLHSFEDAAFFQNNRLIHIYMEDYMLEYEILAAYKTGDEHILAEHDFVNKEVLKKYMEELYTQRDLAAQVWQWGLSGEDRLIVLATCVQGEDEARYLVHGVLKANG